MSDTNLSGEIDPRLHRRHMNGLSTTGERLPLVPPLSPTGTFNASNIFGREWPRMKRFMRFLLRIHSPVVLLSLCCFMILLMLRLREDPKLAHWSWPCVFSPLWVASSLGAICNIYRLWWRDLNGRPRSYAIEQLNSLIFWAAASAVLILIALQANGELDTLVTVLCSPFYVGMALQFVLYFFREYTMVEGFPVRRGEAWTCARPGGFTHTARTRVHGWWCLDIMAVLLFGLAGWFDDLIDPFGLVFLPGCTVPPMLYRAPSYAGLRHLPRGTGPAPQVRQGFPADPVYITSVFVALRLDQFITWNWIFVLWCPWAIWVVLAFNAVVFSFLFPLFLVVLIWRPYMLNLNQEIGGIQYVLLRDPLHDPLRDPLCGLGG